MLLTRNQYLGKLVLAGVPLGCDDEINGNLFRTIPDVYVADSWRAFVEMLDGCEPKLTELLEVGGGKTRLVPKYLAPGIVCRHWAFSFYGFLLLGLAERAARTLQPCDGYAIGPVYYFAKPRAEDRYRDGKHARILYVNDDGVVKQFEEGDGLPEPMIPEELASITLRIAT